MSLKKNDDFCHKIILIKQTKIDVFCIKLPKANLILARAPLGFVMCGYLNICAAEKFQEAAAIVKGVATVEELLDKAVVEVSSQAEKLGVFPGMSGRNALEKML